MNTAEKLRQLIEDTDHVMDEVKPELKNFLEHGWAQTELKGYLKALDEVEKKHRKEWRDFLKPESMENTSLMRILKELRG